MNQPASVSAATGLFQVTLGPGIHGLLPTGLPVLAGPADEKLWTEAKWVGHRGPLALFEQSSWLVGGASLAVTNGLERAVAEMYAAMFQATRGRHLARVWHYVPGINEPGPDGMENYRAFCRARSLAFEQELGSGFQRLLPAASAVGSSTGNFTLVFAASSTAPRHVENPLQVSAYDYPADYGPRAPSFARATVVADRDRPTAFISGTAAIRGHATIAPGEFAPQLECTLENLREISRACDLGDDLRRGPASARHFKVYLRHGSDQPAAARALERSLLRSGDRVSYVQADICRAELQVEIEVTVLG